LGKVVAQVKVGKQPTKVVVSPDGQRLFVMDPSANLVSVVDTASVQVTATIPVGTNPQGLAISPDGSRLYVANRGYNTSTNGRSQLNGSVSVIDAPRNKVVVTVPVHTAS